MRDEPHEPCDCPPVSCLVTTAFHRIALNPDYAEGLAMLINLMLAKLGGTISLTEAEAREFEAGPQRPKLEAYGDPLSDPTQRGWKLTMLPYKETIEQSMTDIIGTLQMISEAAHQTHGEEDTNGLGRFDA